MGSIVFFFVAQDCENIVVVPIAIESAETRNCQKFRVKSDSTFKKVSLLSFLSLHLYSLFLALVTSSSTSSNLRCPRMSTLLKTAQYAITRLLSLVRIVKLLSSAQSNVRDRYVQLNQPRELPVADR